MKSIDTWKEAFGENPVHNKPSIDKVQQAWSDMGTVFGKLQIEKLRYQKAGMKAVVDQINTKWKSEVEVLEQRTLDLMGYPRLPSNIQSQLSSQAAADKLFLNIYKLEEYQKIPPANIAEAIMEAKPYFDKLEVWAIEEEPYIRPVKDPAIVGYKHISGVGNVQFLIATWGEDITPEDMGITVIREIDAPKN